MSTRDERKALTAPVALYELALRLLRESPDGVPVPRGYPLPERYTSVEGLLTWDKAPSAIQEALSPLPDGPATLHRRFERLGIGDRHMRLIESVIAKLPLRDEQADETRALGRRLIRTGATAPTVAAGTAPAGSGRPA